MITLKTKLAGGIIGGIVLLVVGFVGYQQASASVVGNLFNTVTGGQTVRIVSDLSTPAITSALQNTLSRVLAGISAGQLQSLNLKETVLDPIAWNMAKQLQQQLTGDLLKWLGGQQPGQNGQVPFVQDFGEHYAKILDDVAGEFISGEALSGMCSQKASFQVRREVYENYTARSNQGIGKALYQCGGTNTAKTSYRDDTAMGKIMRGVINCDEDSPICAGYNASYELSKLQAGEVAEQQFMLSISKGMLPQQVCKDIKLPSGNTTKDCKVVSPLNVAADAVSFQLGQLPSLQLLQMDEFNEIVSNLMSNLTNQALGGLNGVLGLTNNPDFGLVFNPQGGLSYLDALLQDDISVGVGVSAGSNPIKQSLAAEQRHLNLQTFILNEVVSLESQLSSNSCSLSLSQELSKAKSDASASISLATNASGTIAVLTALDNWHDNASNSADKNAALSEYMKYRGQFKDEQQNLTLESSFIDWQFCTMVDQFKTDMSARCNISHTAGSTCGPNWGP